MRRRGARYGLATMCIGVGQGLATIVENLPLMPPHDASPALLHRRRDRPGRRGDASRSPTTASCAATARSRCCGSTAAGRSRSTDHLDRLDRSAEGIFLEWDRAAFEREIEALLRGERRARRGACGWSLTRGGRRIAIIEPLPAFEHGLTLSSVTYQPTIVLTGLKTLSYDGEHDRDADRASATAPTRRCWSSPTARCWRRRPRRSSGSTATATCTPRSSTPASSPRSRASGSCESCP